MGEARHVYSWGNSDEADPDENVRHVSLGDVCHVWAGVPTMPPFLTRLFCSSKNGRVKK